MNRFDPSTPRTACSVAAIAMAALTIAMMVVVPAQMNSGNPDVIAVATAKALTPAATEVAISPARIDVFAVREGNVAAQSRNSAAKGKQQS